MQQIAATNRIVAEALKTHKNPERALEIEFSVVDLAAKNGWNSGIVKRELKNLQWRLGRGKFNGKYEKSGVLVEFSELAFHFMTLKGQTDEDLEEVLDFLFGKTLMREKAELSSLFRAYRAFTDFTGSENAVKLATQMALIEHILARQF